jgi:hypothetical protein
MSSLPGFNPDQAGKNQRGIIYFFFGFNLFDFLARLVGSGFLNPPTDSAGLTKADPRPLKRQNLSHAPRKTILTA